MIRDISDAVPLRNHGVRFLIVLIPWLMAKIRQLAVGARQQPSPKQTQSAIVAVPLRVVNAEIPPTP
ncbi:MAG TPA: hypothetical protein DDW76_20450 [Cyanobacteria bacterium UBA11369]|nr:hypothetical protein [Cyanobacteria bacterium UBA11368]HBE51081.1 hypothetical protein [Cyanobacteria bacterium UBA11369]